MPCRRPHGGPSTTGRAGRGSPPLRLPQRTCIAELAPSGALQDFAHLFQAQQTARRHLSSAFGVCLRKLL